MNNLLRVYTPYICVGLHIMEYLCSIVSGESLRFVSRGIVHDWYLLGFGVCLCYPGLFSIQVPCLNKWGWMDLMFLTFIFPFTWQCWLASNALFSIMLTFTFSCTSLPVNPLFVLMSITYYRQFQFYSTSILLTDHLSSLLLLSLLLQSFQSLQISQ